MKKIGLTLFTCLALSPLASHANDCVQNLQDHYFKNSYLELQNCNISDKEIPQVISFINKHTVQSLELSGNQITSAGAMQLAAMKTPPQFIELQDNKIGDKGLVALARNSSIKSIGAANSGVTDKGVAQLTKNGTLHMLDLSHNKLTSKSIASLKTLPELRYLYLDGNSQIGDKGMKMLAQMNLLEVSVQKDNPSENTPALAKNSTTASPQKSMSAETKTPALAKNSVDNSKNKKTQPVT